MEVTWKDSDWLCLGLMPTIWTFNWAQEERVPGPDAPVPTARGQAEHRMDLFPYYHPICMRIIQTEFPNEQRDTVQIKAVNFF